MTKLDMDTGAALRILLVEDNPADSDLIRERVEEDDVRRMEICLRENLKEAIATLTQDHFDCILLDLGLPDSAGIETFHALFGEAGDIPVIVMTGNSDRSLAKICIEQGASDYLIKGHANGYIGGPVVNAIERQKVVGQLRKSKENYRALLEGLPDIVMRFDSAGRHLFVSPNVYDIVGIPAESFINKTHRELGFPEEECLFWEACMNECLEQGAFTETDFSMETTAGMKTFNWRLIPERSSDGEVQGLLTIAQDITKHLQAEADFKALFTTMPSAFALHEVVYDAKGRPVDYSFLQVNPAFEKITGLQGKNILGRTVKDVLPGIEQEWIENYGLVVRTGKVAVFEQYSEDLSKHFHVTAYRYAPNQFVTLFSDVTEQHTTREALRTSEENFRVLSESSPVAVYRTDKDGACLYVNPRWLELAGIKIEDALGDGWIDAIHPEDRERIGRAWSRSVASDGQWGYEYRFMTPEGKSTWVYGRARAILDDEGNIAGYIGSNLDISELKAAESALNDAHKLTVRQERLGALGQMASGIAHDFNNVLMPIIGFTDLLVSKPDDYLNNREELVSLLSQIQEAAEDARHIVKRLRLVHKPDDPSVMMPVEINEIIESAVNLTRPRWKEEMAAEGRPVMLKLKLKPSRKRVSGITSELREAVMNLILNAVDAMPEGGNLAIETSFDPNYASVLISDSGQGMSEEERNKCLEPFFTTKGANGSGLGLAMVNGIMERHNGTLEIESAPGTGTLIRLILPYTELDIRKPKSSGGVASPVPQALNILVVDDDARVLSLTRQILQRDGHNITAVKDGDKAIRLFEHAADDYDLVISDRAMPEVNGDQVLAAARACNPDVMTILLTGFGDIMNDENEVPPSVDKVMSKPASSEDFRAAMNELILNRTPHSDAQP